MNIPSLIFIAKMNLLSNETQFYTAMYKIIAVFYKVFPKKFFKNIDIRLQLCYYQ